MKINKYDKKLTIGLTKKLFFRNNINLNCILGTKKDGEYESFLKKYDIKD